MHYCRRVATRAAADPKSTGTMSQNNNKWNNPKLRLGPGMTGLAKKYDATPAPTYEPPTQCTMASYHVGWCRFRTPAMMAPIRAPASQGERATRNEVMAATVASRAATVEPT